MKYNTKLYLLVLYIGFLAPFLLRGLTWAMLYVWTKNYPQVVGTCSGHHGQLISQNCVPTKIRAEPPPLMKILTNPDWDPTGTDFRTGAGTGTGTTGEIRYRYRNRYRTGTTLCHRYQALSPVRNQYQAVTGTGTGTRLSHRNWYRY